MEELHAETTVYMKTMTKIVIPIGILAVGLIAMFGLLSLRSDSPKRTPQKRAKILRTAVVDLQTVSARITAYGRLTSAQPVILTSEVAGKIEEGDILFRPAQKFKKRDLIVRVDDRQAILNLNSRKSELLTALATVLPEIKVDFPKAYPEWQEYFDRISFDQEVPPLPETENQRIKLYLSRYRVYNLYFAVRDLEIALDKHHFYAPFDGAIQTAALRVGATARAGTVLGEIINLDDLEVEVPMAVQDIGWIDRKKSVVFSSQEIAGLWSGEIRRVGSTIDTRTQTVPVYIGIENGSSLPVMSGIFLQAEIPGRNIESAFTLPNGAVYGEKFVYIIADGKLASREVSIARRQLDSIIIDGGLMPGDTVVMEALQGVVPGMPAESRIESSGDRGGQPL